VRLLEDADRVLYLLVHAAKHGARAPKWLLDLWVETQEFQAWDRLIERAREAGVTRPAWAAARLVAELPGARVPEGVLASLRPRPAARLLLRALVRPEARARWHDYGREIVLEESVWRRARMVGGVIERALRSAKVADAAHTARLS
jgi:hypothetical protein